MSLAIALVLFAQSSVTVTFPPTPVPKALEILSKATRQRLQAAGFKDDVILARLKNAPVQATLTHLAESLDAKWEPRDGFLLLVKDAESLRRKSAAMSEASRTTLVNSLAYNAKRLAQQPPELDRKAILNYEEKLAREAAQRKAAEEAKDYARMFVGSTAAEESPGWRALAKLLAVIGPNRMLQLPNDAIGVWSENANPMQIAFPIQARKILEQYRREFSILKPEAQVIRVKVLAKRWEFGGSFNTALIALDGQNKEVDHVYIRLNDDSERMKIPFTERNKVVAKPDEKPLEVPEEAQEARVALASDSATPQSAAMISKWRERVLDPIHFEPTQWHFGVDLISTAEALDKNLIGTVPDYTGSRYWETKTKQTPSQLLAKNYLQVKTTPDGWLVAMPSEEVVRSSREKAFALLRNSVKAGGVSVDDASKWAAENPGRWPFSTWLGDYMGFLFSSQGPYSATATLMDDFSLRFWDDLGPANRRGLKEGMVLNLSTMNPKAKRLLFEMVFWNEDTTGLPDPTDQFPNGITDGSIQLTITEKPVFNAWSSTVGPPTTLRPMDAQSFGNSLAKGNTWWEVPADVYQSYDRFTVGVYRSYSLNIKLEPGNIPVEIELGETFFDPGVQAVSKLPAKVAAEVEKARLAALAKPAEEVKKSTIPPR